MSDKAPVILFVDDDPDYREVVRLIFQGRGYELLEASSGEEGLEVYQRTRPDLIIVDLMMEEVDTGTRFAKELKLLGNMAPIYMLSSVGEDMNLSADHASMGLAGIFQKPISPTTLLSVVKQRLGR